VSSHLLDSALVETIGWALINFIWQGTLIGGATAVLLRAINPQKARMRYLVACLGLMSMPIAPVFSVVTSDAHTVELVTTASASAAIAKGVPIDRMLPVAVAIWMAGVVLLSIRLVAACIGVERLKRATREVDEVVSLRLRALGQRLGVVRTVHVFASEAVRVPTVVGWLRPVILLPVSVITALPATHLDAVLAHELAHVRRHDYLVNAVQTIVETLLFYHPAVWWCSRQIRIEREHCCDDLVVEACGDRVGYARALAQLEELRGLEPMLSLNATGGRLIDRVRRMLGHEPMNARRSTTWMIAAGLTVLVAAVILAPVMTFAGADDGRMMAQDDVTLQEPPEPPEPPLAPRPPRERQPRVAPAPPPAPVPPIEPAPAVPTAPTAPPAPPATPQIPSPPTALAVPAPPAPLEFPLPPVGPLPPAPPVPPDAFGQIDPDSIAREMRRASEELAKSFDDLRRATEDINARQEALHQAQAELAKMQVETLAKNTRMEAIRRAMAELSAAMASSRLGQLKEEALRKEIEAIRKQMEDLRAR
jgi:beta-lactamase regulating signal transducer with metallopeptidase domain